MGSLTSGPKAPSQPQVLYVPTPTQATTTTPSTATQPSADENAAQARTQSLLSRSRGRLGTIATSFRGFLSEKDNSVKRKTLLGE